MIAPRVFVVDRFVDQVLPRLRARFPGVEFGGVNDASRFPEETLDADVLLSWRCLPGWPARLPRLRWIQATGAGVDRIVFTGGLPPGLLVTRLVANLPAQMAEHALAAVMHAAAGWPAWERQQRAREWARPPRRTLVRGACAGVMGLGEIGAETVRALAAAGMDVRGWSRGGAAVPGCARVFPEARLVEFLSGVEYLVLALPLTARTRGLLDEATLARLAPGSVLVNMARAEIVGEAALAAALESGRIREAYLDVFWDEPLPRENPWWAREHVHVTPHIAGITETGDLVHEFSENLERYRRGEPLRNLVDMARGY